MNAKALMVAAPALAVASVVIFITGMIYGQQEQRLPVAQCDKVHMLGFVSK